MTLPLDPEGVATVITCINGGSWSSDEKQALVFATFKQVSSKTLGIAPSNRNQRCLWFERYLYDADWPAIQRTSGEITLVLPCENTLGRMLSVLFGAVGG